MSQTSFIRDFLFFLRNEKKWWIIPLITILAVSSLMLLLGNQPTAVPHLYPVQ